MQMKRRISMHPGGPHPRSCSQSFPGWHWQPTKTTELRLICQFAYRSEYRACLTGTFFFKSKNCGGHCAPFPPFWNQLQDVRLGIICPRHLSDLGPPGGGAAAQSPRGARNTTRCPTIPPRLGRSTTLLLVLRQAGKACWGRAEVFGLKRGNLPWARGKGLDVVLFTPLRVGWPPTPQVYFGPWEGLRVVSPVGAPQAKNPPLWGLP